VCQCEDVREKRTLHMKSIFLSFFVYLTVGLVLSIAADNKTVPFIRIPGDRISYIIPAEAGPSCGIYVDGKPCAKFWTPTVEDAKSADAAVWKFVAEKNQRNKNDLNLSNTDKRNSKELPKIETNEPKYGRQFVGVIFEGKKYIYCNFFSVDVLTDQKAAATYFFQVYDGGYWFWQIYYSPDTKSCFGLKINGEA